MSTSTLLEGFAVRPEADGRPQSDVPIRRQWLDVEGFITDRLLVTYRAPAERLRTLLPQPFVLDERNGFGFVSVCALEVVQMGVRRSPGWLRFTNRELLYRIGVRYQDRPTFLTLRSDTASRALALLGGSFSHYALRRARISLTRAQDRFDLRCEARDGRAHARLVTDLRPTSSAPASLFPDVAGAADFLIGMSFSAGIRGGTVLLQAILHDPWQPHFVATEYAHFDYLGELAQRIGAPLTYDNTLHVQGVQQIWKVAQWQT